MAADRLASRVTLLLLMAKKCEWWHGESVKMNSSCLRSRVICCSTRTSCCIADQLKRQLRLRAFLPSLEVFRCMEARSLKQISSRFHSRGTVIIASSFERARFTPYEGFCKEKSMLQLTRNPCSRRPCCMDRAAQGGDPHPSEVGAPKHRKQTEMSTTPSQKTAHARDCKKN